MNGNNEWGIAMQGNAEVINNAINDAISKLKETPNFQLRENKIIYIEIGTGEGKTVVQVCKILEKAGVDFIAVAVDIEDGWSFNQEAYLDNIQEFVHCVELDLSGSPEALKRFDNQQVFAVLIDGDHSFDAVVKDFKEADRIVMKGGLIMFHDSGVDSQGADKFDRQPHGIQVREFLDYYDMPTTGYELVVDHPDTEGTRGIFIMRKTK